MLHLSAAGWNPLSYELPGIGSAVIADLLGGGDRDGRPAASASRAAAVPLAPPREALPPQASSRTPPQASPRTPPQASPRAIAAAAAAVAATTAAPAEPLPAELPPPYEEAARVASCGASRSRRPAYYGPGTEEERAELVEIIYDRISSGKTWPPCKTVAGCVVYAAHGCCVVAWSRPGATADRVKKYTWLRAVANRAKKWEGLVHLAGAYQLPDQYGADRPHAGIICTRTNCEKTMRFVRDSLRQIGHAGCMWHSTFEDMQVRAASDALWV